MPSSPQLAYLITSRSNGTVRHRAAVRPTQARDLAREELGRLPVSYGEYVTLISRIGENGGTVQLPDARITVEQVTMDDLWELLPEKTQRRLHSDWAIKNTAIIDAVNKLH